MYMTPGTAFTGRGGVAYSTATQVEPADISLAFRNGWTPADQAVPTEISVTLASGATHNLSPVGFGGATLRLEVTPNAAGSTLGGLLAGADNQTLVIANVGASGTLTLTHQDASSNAANRFEANADVALTPGNSAITRYSATQSRWLVAL